MLAVLQAYAVKHFNSEHFLNKETCYLQTVYAGAFICDVAEKSGVAIAIPGARVCDGIIDCFDASDEDGCTGYITLNHTFGCMLGAISSQRLRHALLL